MPWSRDEQRMLTARAVAELNLWQRIFAEHREAFTAKWQKDNGRPVPCHHGPEEGGQRHGGRKGVDRQVGAHVPRLPDRVRCPRHAGKGAGRAAECPGVKGQSTWHGVTGPCPGSGTGAFRQRTTASRNASARGKRGGGPRFFLVRCTAETASGFRGAAGGKTRNASAPPGRRTGRS